MTRRSLILTLGLSLGLVLTTLVPAAAQDAADPNRLRVITYNVQFLPGPAAAVNKRKEPDYRAARIAEEVAKFDLVALQEVFDQKWQDAIAYGVRKVWGDDHFHRLSSPMADGHQYTGGCMILSKHPFASTDTMVFEHFSKPEDFGVRADGYAAKGVIHARVTLPSPMSAIDVFATHLEARDDSLRPAQYAEMAVFIKRVADPSRPTLLLGDLNTRGMKEERNNPDSQYSVLMKALNDARSNATAFQDIWPTLMGEALGGTSEQESADIGKRIDYVLLSNPQTPAPQLTPTTIAVNLFQDPRIVALSDHNAVEAEFTIGSKPQN